jgi:hypothetical protein
MSTDWEEPLVPRARSIERSCSCDADGACVHVAALGFAVAAEIDRDPSTLLRWRGCVSVPVVPVVATAKPVPVGDLWSAASPPTPRQPRPLPVGAVLKRLGPSGIRVGGDDLTEVLQRAYASFARS